jgi:hypothetical protein
MSPYQPYNQLIRDIWAPLISPLWFVICENR